MPKPHLNCLDDQSAQALMAIPKYTQEKLSWSKANNQNFRIAQFVPIDMRDDFGGTLAGVSIQIEQKRPKRIKQSHKLLFTLFQLHNKVKYRAYQLEVSDENKKSSHNEQGDVFGCHEHIGEQVIKIQPQYPQDDLENWFATFSQRINLDFQGELPKESET